MKKSSLKHNINIHNKNILVTGGAGFIGYHLVKRLIDGNNKITVIDNFTRNSIDNEFDNITKNSNINLLNEDLTEKSFYQRLDKQYDYIFHLAAINGTKYFYEKPYEVLRVNILSLMNILEWINTDNCGKFLYSSSSEAYSGTIIEYGKNNTYIPTSENIPLCINDIFNERFSYGGSKLIGELLTINYYKKSKHKNFSIIRYHNIYGPRMGFEHVMPEFCKRIFLNENPFKIYGGEETRAFCFIDDAIDATILSMVNECCDGQVLHIGNDEEEIKIIDLAKKLLKLNDSDAEIFVNSAPEGSVGRRCPDIAKIKSLTGYSPKINIDNGLKILSDWYMEKYTNKI